MKSQFFYIIFYKFALKATEIGNRKESVEHYNNSQRLTKDVDMTEDIYERIFDLMNKIVIKLENTFIIKDGHDKRFEPSREHTHENEHKLFYNWLTFFKRTLENMNNNPKTILESIFFYNREIKLFKRPHRQHTEPYLFTWMNNSNEYLITLKYDFKLVQGDKLTKNRLQSFYSFCEKFNAELDVYIYEAFKHDMKLFISCHERILKKSFFNIHSLWSEREKMFRLKNEHPCKKPEQKRETKVEIHNFSIRQRPFTLINYIRFYTEEGSFGIRSEGEDNDLDSDVDERYRDMNTETE